MILGTTIVAALLALWFTVSVIGQFDSELARRLRSHDHFSLIPRWTFFAPRPGVTDYHLLYQGFQHETDFAWREVALSEPRTLFGAIWNPQKRNRKALGDSVRAFVRMTRSLDHETLWQLQYTIPYIAVLSYLADISKSAECTHIRFIILESDGYYSEQEPRLLFLSARHATT